MVTGAYNLTMFELGRKSELKRDLYMWNIRGQMGSFCLKYEHDQKWDYALEEMKNDPDIFQDVQMVS